MSIFYRCDDCCNIMGDINGGIVYDCSKIVQEKFNFEHICEDCLCYQDDLFLHTDGNIKIVMQEEKN